MSHQDIIRCFFDLYGKQENPPECYFAPGRVNLIGEHTDYNGGYVLPCALQYGTYMIIRQIEEPVLRLASENFPFRTEVPLSGTFSRIDEQWVNYPLGVMDQLRKQGLVLAGMEIMYCGDIPNNAGLSSSASIEMVTAFAINDIFRAGLTMMDLIRLSQMAENQFVGVNCGIMDQFAVGMGARNHAIFLNCRTLEYTTVPLKLDGFTLMVANTNKRRGLADSKYNERVAECQKAVTCLNEAFNISQLGEISFMQFFKEEDLIPDDLIRRRARHVISENQRVLNAVSCLWKRNILEFGALMDASHESLRDNYEVTGTELDTMVDEARKLPYVIGSRMTGAGFGGCTVSVVKTDEIDQFIDIVGKKYFEKTGLTPVFYAVEASDGVRKI